MQESLKVLESVNSFYSQSFSQLISITVAVLAFAGIVLPVLITLYQKRIFSLEHNAIEKSIHDKLKKELDLIVVTIRDEYQQKEVEHKAEMAEMKSNIAMELADAEGGIYHVQGNAELSSGQYLIALNSFLNAGFRYVKAESNQNLRRILNQCIDFGFPNVTSEDLDDDKGFEKNFESLIEKIEIYDEKYNFVDQITLFRRAYQNAKNQHSQKAEMIK